MLLEGGVIPQKEYEASQADMSEASAEAMRARARLKNLGASNSKSTNSNLSDEGFVLRAPLNGIIVDRQINPGSEVRPDLPNPLFIITDPSHLWATIDLPERDLNKINEGQSISIEVDAYPGETFPGRVQSVGAMVDPASRRIPVRCIVLDGKGKLRPEMYARITPLSASAEKVIQVPNKALITEGLYSYVFVEVGPGRLKKRQVTLNTQGRDFATVKEGLQAGDRLVTSGAILLNSELSEGK
jgi:cobalt-zinc-cadmium efflux system membrane fusion protein